VPVPHDPPSFTVGSGQVSLTFGAAPALLTVTARTVEPLKEPSSFRLSYVDITGDGFPDDADQDGVVDVYPQFLLRYLPDTPLPGNAETIVPLSYVPTTIALLFAVGGQELERGSLTLLYVPNAQRLSQGEDGKLELTALDEVPRGEYELVVLARGGQVWKVPNALGAKDVTQAVRIRLDP
jgi:hypothetical protein